MGPNPGTLPLVSSISEGVEELSEDPGQGHLLPPPLRARFSLECAVFTTICTEPCLDAGSAMTRGCGPSGLLAVNWPILLEVAVIRPCGAPPEVPLPPRPLRSVGRSLSGRDRLQALLGLPPPRPRNTPTAHEAA